MGTVHQVQHRAWGMDLAVKSPKRTHMTPSGTENFVRECQTWVQLGLHPHVVSCYYVRVMGGLPRVFAEYVDGGSLADWIRTRRLYRGGPAAALARVLDVAIQFAWGLDHAHEQGLVHQDVKPGNVMLTRAGVAKITDFGLSRARGFLPAAERADAGASVMVASGGMTPAYCSPEQAASRPLTRRTDVWSWGLSVLEMFTGGVSWLSGQLAGAVLRDYLDAPPEDPDLPRMPQAVAQLLARCFAADPAARPARLRPLAEELVLIHDAVTGRAYHRAVPRALDSRAGDLNNRALSLLDLGDAAAAEQAWQDALKLDPLHPESVYNHGLSRWRAGQVTDEALLARLAASSGAFDDGAQPGLGAFLTAWVHVERGDLAAAQSLVDALPQDAQREAQDLRQGLLDVGARASTPVDSASSEALALLDRGNGVMDVARARTLSVQALPSAEQVVLDDAVSRQRLWAVDLPRTGQARDPLASGLQPPGSRVCLSAGGRIGIAFPERTQVVVLDAFHGRVWRVLDGVDLQVLNAALSEDGRLAVLVLGTAGSSKMALWEVDSGRCLHTFERHAAGTPLHRMQAVGINRRANLVVSADADSMLRLWRLDDGRFLRALGGHVGAVQAVSLSLDGSCAASLGQDRTIRLWDLPAGRCRRTLPAPAAAPLSAPAAAPLPDRPRPAPWRIARVTATEIHVDRDAQARALLQQADRSAVDGQVERALSQLRQVRAIPGWERDAQALAAWRQMATRCRKTVLRGVWPIRGNRTPPLRLSAVALAADGRWAFGGDARGGLHAIDLLQGQSMCMPAAHAHAVSSVCLNRDATLGLSSAGDRVCLWRLPAMVLLRSFAQVDDNWRRLEAPTAIHLRDDGRVALVVGRGAVQVWDPAAGTLLRSLDMPDRGAKLPTDDGEARHTHVVAVHACADGLRALAASGEQQVFEWHLATGTLLRTLTPEPAAESLSDRRLQSSLRLEALGHQGRYVLAPAADLSGLLLGGTGHPTRWVDLSTGAVSAVPGTNAPFMSAVSGDGRIGLSHVLSLPHGDRFPLQPRVLQVWDRERGVLLHAFEPASARAQALALSLDASTAALGLEEGETQFWHLDWELTPHADDAHHSVADQLHPHLDQFLQRHRTAPAPVDPSQPLDDAAIVRALTRRGQPRWNEDDFQALLGTLGHLGLGHVPAGRVRSQLEQQAAAATQGGV